MVTVSFHSEFESFESTIIFLLSLLVQSFSPFFKQKNRRNIHYQAVWYVGLETFQNIGIYLRLDNSNIVPIDMRSEKIVFQKITKTEQLETRKMYHRSRYNHGSSAGIVHIMLPCLILEIYILTLDIHST